MTDRRDFMQKALVFMCAMITQYLAPRNVNSTFMMTSRPYHVKFRCLVPESSDLDQFEKDREGFEQTEKIIETNEIFLNDGRLMKTEHRRSTTHLEWEYLFKDKSSYQQWNRLIYKSNYYSRSKVPSKYQVSVTETHA